MDETTKNAAYERFRKNAVEKYGVPESTLPKNRDAFADFRVQQFFVAGLTKEQQIKLFEPEEGAKPSFTDEQIRSAGEQRLGRKMTPAEFLADKKSYEAELSAGRRKPQEEIDRKLQESLLRVRELQISQKEQTDPNETKRLQAEGEIEKRYSNDVNRLMLKEIAGDLEEGQLSEEINRLDARKEKELKMNTERYGGKVAAPGPIKIVRDTQGRIVGIE